jgi:DHA1 family inner membrane transport protein
VGWQESDLRWLYLCGGLATLLANPLAGRLADRFGKVLVFRGLVLLTMLPIVLVSNGGPGLLGMTLAATTMLVVCSSGQTVPALALITSCAPAASRGSFLSVNAAVQQLAMGLGALLAGSLLSQAGPGQPLEGYPLVGLLACAVALLSFGLVGAIGPANATVDADDLATDEGAVCRGQHRNHAGHILCPSVLTIQPGQMREQAHIDIRRKLPGGHSRV